MCHVKMILIFIKFLSAKHTFTMSYFELLSSEELCFIIENVTDLCDIESVIQISKRFNLLAPHCIIELKSSKLVYVKLSNINTFYNVMTIDPKIMILIDSECELTKLQSAVFMCPVIELLQFLPRNEKRNFKIVIDGSTLVIKNDKYMIFPEQSMLKGSGISKILDKLNLTELILPISNSGILRPSFKEFLLTADFGSENPLSSNPISACTRRLANFGIIDLNLAYAVLLVYIKYHKLEHDGILAFDQTLKKYFGFVEEFEKHINLNSMTHDNILTIIQYMTMFNGQTSYQEILEFEIPTSMPSVEQFSDMYSIFNNTLALY